MKLILKILFFVLTTFQTNISEAKVIVFADVSEPIFSNAFYLEKSEDRLRNVFFENDLINTCKSESNLVYYRSWCISYNADATKTSTSLVQINRNAGNLFRDELAAALRAEGRIVNPEVFKRTPLGPRYMDLDVWHKGVNLGEIETKVGGSPYLPLQRLKDAWLGANGYPVNLVRKPGTW